MTCLSVITEPPYRYSGFLEAHSKRTKKSFGDPKHQGNVLHLEDDRAASTTVKSTTAVSEPRRRKPASEPTSSTHPTVVAVTHQWQDEDHDIPKAMLRAVQVLNTPIPSGHQLFPVEKTAIFAGRSKYFSSDV